MEEVVGAVVMIRMMMTPVRKRRRLSVAPLRQRVPRGCRGGGRCGAQGMGGDGGHEGGGGGGGRVVPEAGPRRGGVPGIGQGRRPGCGAVFLMVLRVFGLIVVEDLPLLVNSLPAVEDAEYRRPLVDDQSWGAGERG